MFYAILAGFFAAMLMIFFKTMDDHRPSMTGMDSLIKGNPGKASFVFAHFFLRHDVYLWNAVKHMQGLNSKFSKWSPGTIWDALETWLLKISNVCPFGKQCLFWWWGRLQFKPWYRYLNMRHMVTVATSLLTRPHWVYEYHDVVSVRMKAGRLVPVKRTLVIILTAW